MVDAVADVELRLFEAQLKQGRALRKGGRGKKKKAGRVIRFGEGRCANAQSIEAIV